MRRKAVPKPGLKNKNRGDPPSSKTTEIGRLPNELVERIFRKVLEVDLAREEHGSVDWKAPALDCRLVSKQFRDMSYRALGRVIAATTFDMCSQDSMNNLEAISKCKSLAPWIIQLNFTCTPPLELDQDNFWVQELDHTVECELLQQMKEEERGNLYFSTWLTRENFDSRDTALESALARWIKRFKNLESAAFACVSDQPAARYGPAIKSFSVNTVLDDDVDAEYYEHETFSLQSHIGLQILFCSLAASNAYLQSFDLGVELVGFNAFNTSVPLRIIAKACKRVKTLRLWDCYELSHDDFAPENIMVTRDLFLALRALTIDCDTDDFKELDTEWPAISKVPILSSLGIAVRALQAPDTWKFVERYGQSAKHITLRYPRGGELGDVLAVLEEIRPDRLTLEYGDENFWDPGWRMANTSFTMGGSWTTPSEDDQEKLLDAFEAMEEGTGTALGASVQMGPQKFVDWLWNEGRWADEEPDPAIWVQTEEESGPPIIRGPGPVWRRREAWE